MAEETVGRGPSSKVKNLGVFLVSGLCRLIFSFAILWRNESTTKLSPYVSTPAIVPIFIALALFLQTKKKVYAADQ